MNIYKLHNKSIEQLLREDYTISHLDQIYNLLYDQETFEFKSLKNGLFPASQLKRDNQFTNYDKVWVRDNVFISLAYYINGAQLNSQETLYSLSDFFYKYKYKIINIINGISKFDEPMNRPHIRFDGDNLAEIKEKWAHAENDALGYYIWMMFKMANNFHLDLRQKEIELVSLFINYFDRISYWEDEDSGHWEEVRKIEASSIGVVLSALCEIKKYIDNPINESLLNQDRTLLDILIQKGKESILKILPNECIQKEPNKFRDVDAAQLFLIYPMELFENVIHDEILENTILMNVINKLKGEYGIKRYLGDSFWTADAKKKQKQSELTADFSENIDKRDKDHITGEEAQWCIFDSIISIIYGKRYSKNGLKNDYQQQIHYFNRALAQITGDDCKYGAFKCPELYYLENGHYTYNDTVPLLWSQANLLLAFNELRRSLILNTFGD